MLSLLPYLNEKQRRIAAAVEARSLGYGGVSDVAKVNGLSRTTLHGIPANPRAWLVSIGRFKSIDGMRRRARHDARYPLSGVAWFGLPTAHDLLTHPTPVALKRDLFLSNHCPFY